MSEITSGDADDHEPEVSPDHGQAATDAAANLEQEPAADEAASDAAADDDSEVAATPPKAAAKPEATADDDSKDADKDTSAADAAAREQAAQDKQDKDAAAERAQAEQAKQDTADADRTQAARDQAAEEAEAEQDQTDREAAARAAVAAAHRDDAEPAEDDRGGEGEGAGGRSGERGQEAADREADEDEGEGAVSEYPPDRTREAYDRQQAARAPDPVDEIEIPEPHARTHTGDAAIDEALAGLSPVAAAAGPRLDPSGHPAGAPEDITDPGAIAAAVDAARQPSFAGQQQAGTGEGTAAGATPEGEAATGEAGNETDETTADEADEPADATDGPTFTDDGADYGEEHADDGSKTSQRPPDGEDEGSHRVVDIPVTGEVIDGLQEVVLGSTETKKMVSNDYPDALFRTSSTGESRAGDLEEIRADYQSYQGMETEDFRVTPFSVDRGDDGRLYVVAHRVEGVALPDAIARSPEVARQYDQIHASQIEQMAAMRGTDSVYPSDAVGAEQFMWGRLGGTNDPASVIFVDVDPAGDKFVTGSAEANPGFYLMTLATSADTVIRTEAIRADVRMQQSRAALDSELVKLEDSELNTEQSQRVQDIRRALDTNDTTLLEW